MKKPRKRRYLARLDPETLYFFRLHNEPLKTHERPTHAVFLRLNSRRKTFYAKDFAAAGYPMAVLRNLAQWPAVHRWCHEQFRDKCGRTYTWTGEKFWFQTEADRQKFIERWG
jgi:hypothetical protein